MIYSEGPFESKALIVNYANLGTMNIDELVHALVADVKTLKDNYNIQFVRDTRLKLFATNEYGDDVRIVRPEGGILRYMRTSHFRPACLDYKL